MSDFSWNGVVPVVVVEHAAPLQRWPQNSAGRVVEEDDVRRTPHGAGNGAVGLAGHDDLEKFWRGGEISHERLVGIGWQRLRDSQVLENCEDDFGGGSERSFHSGAPES